MDEERALEPVSIEASLTESGVSLNARSRFVSALDRLFGGIFSVPAAHLEARVSKTRLMSQLDREETRRKAELRLAGELKTEQLELAAAYIAQERQTKQMLNLTAVARIALEDLADEKRHSDSADENVEGAISDDWLNWFESYAEKATDDDIRRLWGKVLAGETRKPGSFSLGTLRVISETDQRLAELVRDNVSEIFAGRYLLKTDEDTRGERLLELSMLEDAGYLREVSGMLSLNWKFDQDGRFIHRTKNVVFIAEGPAALEFQIPVILVSRCALQLLAVLPVKSFDVVYRRLSTLMPPATTSIKLGLIIQETPVGQISWVETEVLKEAVSAS